MSWWKKLVDKARDVYGMPAPTSPAQDGCNHESIHLRQGTAEFEWFVARGELETTHNLKHGAGHLANLLAYDPGNPEWINLLEKYLAAAAPNPELLIPRGDKLYYATEAMRAYIWNKLGRLHEAIQLLIDVTHAKQDARYLEAWALSWLEPPGAVESLPEQLGMHLFALALNRYPEARLSPLLRLREIQRWARLCERLVQSKPDRGMTTMFRAGLLRKAGFFEDAERVVRASLEREPDWHSATALGLILRQKGDCAEAEKAFLHALQLDPDDVSARLEAGDMFFERQQWQSALAWYENALSKETRHPWALPSALFCRWKLNGDERHFRDMIELAKKDNSRARQLWHQEFGGLPEPVDATANLLRQFRERILQDPKKAPSGEARMTLSCLEAPSNYLAFRMEMAALRHDLRLLVAVNEIPKPDPREPIADIKYLLWRYEGIDGVPALPAPPAEVVARIAELAAMPFEEQANWAAASRVAEELGAGRAGEVLAVMVHPPAIPDPAKRSALSWLPRVQLAAAQVVAQMDNGWERSVRREALLSVLFGPSDWTTEAAIRVLARIGYEQEALAPDIHDAFQKLDDHRQNSGYCCWEHTLFQSWLYLPHLYPQERKKLEQTLREIESRGQSDGN
jgi:tetratricopeptide (TPR) repeat protein